jgi:hypothetical protein
MFTYITDTSELYILAECSELSGCTKANLKGPGYQIYMIDLDSNQPRVANKEGKALPLFEYTHEEVNHESAQSFHVRGSSHKEKINLNKCLICYMLHGTKLRVWTDDDDD